MQEIEGILLIRSENLSRYILTTCMYKLFLKGMSFPGTADDTTNGLHTKEVVIYITLHHQNLTG